MRIKLGLLLLALMNSGMTCGGGPKIPSFSPALKVPMEDILKEIRAILKKDGFEIDRYDVNAGYIETEWKVRLAPHWRDGNRRRLKAVARKKERGIVVELTCPKEVNDTSTEPMNLSRASWISVGYDMAYQDRIAWLLKLKFTNWRKD